MTKGKFHWKWLAMIVGVTALAIVATLLVCILNQEELCTPGFSYDDFAAFYGEGSTTYLASPDGNLYVMDNMGNEGTVTAYLTTTSMDRSTMVYPRSDGVYTVISPQGIRVLEQQVVYPTSSVWPATVSFYGDAVYLFAQDDDNPGYAVLWRYDVKQDSEKKLGNFLGGITDCVVSPNGDCFALLDESHTIHIFICKDGKVELRRWPVDYDARLYFLTDDGVIFFGESTGGLQSLRGESNIYDFPDTQAENLANVLFNQDATEMIVNLKTGGCYLYELENGVVKDSVQLKDEGNLELFTNTDASVLSVLPVAGSNTMKSILGVQHAVVDVESFRQLNLRDAETAERVKLTKDNKLVYQQNSATMHGELVPGGNYILYTDANGDYFYTDTDDETGTYHLLWEASECDIWYVAATTGHKSFYYIDTDGNFRYAKSGKDTVLWQAEQWGNVSDYAFEYSTDTIYAVIEETLYCSHAGETPRKVATQAQLFPWPAPKLFSDTAAGVYWGVLATQTDGMEFYRLYPDGTYRHMEE